MTTSHLLWLLQPNPTNPFGNLIPGSGSGREDEAVSVPIAQCEIRWAIAEYQSIINGLLQYILG